MDWYYRGHVRRMRYCRSDDTSARAYMALSASSVSCRLGLSALSEPEGTSASGTPNEATQSGQIK